MADASAPREGVAYGVSLGSSFAADTSCSGPAYAAFKYDWRAPAIDQSKPAVVRRDCGGGDTSAVAVEFPSVGGDNTDACINYRGTYVKTKRDTTHPSRDTGVECALVFDPQAGSFRVEKIDAVVKSLRVARDLKTDADGVGVGVAEDATTATTTHETPATKKRQQDQQEQTVMEIAAAAVAAAGATAATRTQMEKQTETDPPQTQKQKPTAQPSAFAQFVSESESESESESDVEE